MTNVFKNFVSATIAKLASDGGLWLGERVRAAFQAFTMDTRTMEAEHTGPLLDKPENNHRDRK